MGLNNNNLLHRDLQIFNFSTEGVCALANDLSMRVGADLTTSSCLEDDAGMLELSYALGDFLGTVFGDLLPALYTFCCRWPLPRSPQLRCLTESFSFFAHKPLESHTRLLQ